jgi:hypothetical protein
MLAGRIVGAKCRTVHHLDLHSSAVGEARQGQRWTRERLRGQLKEALTAEAAEPQWRVTAAVQFIEAMFGTTQSPIYLAYLDPRGIEPRRSQPSSNVM